MRVPGYVIVTGILLASFSLGLALSSMGGAERGRPPETGRLATAVSSPGTFERSTWASAQSSSGLPNIPLRTQDGREVRFYDDLVKNKSVIINFIYTQCGGICPLATANLAKVHGLLGDRMGRDIQMLTISLDPAVDTPEVLKRYAQAWGNKKGWLYLTGSDRDVTLLRRRMGLYEPDPALDAEKISHTGLVTFGNDKTGRWATLPVGMDSRELAQAIVRITRPMSHL